MKWLGVDSLGFSAMECAGESEYDDGQCQQLCLTSDHVSQRVRVIGTVVGMIQMMMMMITTMCPKWHSPEIPGVSQVAPRC